MKYILALFLLLPFAGYSQKLKVNEFDKFTKQHRLETSPVTLKAKFSEGIAVTFRTVDTSIFVLLSGYGAGTGVIGSDDRAIFLLDDGTTVSVYSTGVQTYNINKMQDSYNHQYRISFLDLNTLSNHDVKSIRKYTAKGYADIDIPEKNAGSVKKIAALIIGNL
jgi:hypothetical protein